jgi:hypothetical protein
MKKVVFLKIPIPTHDFIVSVKISKEIKIGTKKPLSAALFAISS